MLCQQIKCYCCGKFISHKDIDEGKTEQKEIWCGGPIPDLDRVEYICPKCIEKQKGTK